MLLTQQTALEVEHRHRIADAVHNMMFNRDQVLVGTPTFFAVRFDQVVCEATQIRLIILFFGWTGTDLDQRLSYKNQPADIILLEIANY